MAPQIYCHICGGPFLENNDTWLGQAVVLSTGHQTQNGIEIDDFWPFPLDQNGYHVNQQASGEADRVLLRFNSVYDCDNGTFQLLEWNESVKPSIPDHLSSHPRGGSLYVAIHNVCLQLADRFIDTASTMERAVTSTTSGRITSELQLWEVLCRRVDQFGRDTMANEPHNFFLPPDSHSWMPWEQEYDPGECSFLDPAIHALLMANPLDIPNITQSILENLKAIPDTEPRPYETQDESCESLVIPRAHPWLWDLDTGSIRAKQTSDRRGWESLLRSLSQPDIHMPSNESLQIPLSLRNRRRIWRILEEARVNDLPVTRNQGPPGHKFPITSETPRPHPVPRPPPPSHVSEQQKPGFQKRPAPRIVERDGIRLRFPPREPGLIGFGIVPVPGFPARASS
ncbi:hypothetical protein KCU93_g5258, partial [Aureobasidium melanogenum]